LFCSVSPSTLRRYRAERLLREEFERLRSGVVASASRRLRAVGVRLDASDLDASYAQAWQGLYAAMLEGQQITNPAGWLTLVTYRRAIDEHRARSRVQCAVIPSEAVRDRLGVGAGALGVSSAAGPAAGVGAVGEGRDLADELDDRTTLRQLFEALRGRLTAREQQAATLCYLQGLSRSEAAARMGVSESRMRKLMEGCGTGSPGVAGKVGALVETIRAGEWCEEQGSLMRGFAYGILDPDGERYSLALIHRDECPACRAYVLSLRGLAAVLPPVPLLLHPVLGAGASAGSASGAAVGASTGTTVAAPTSAGVAGGALSASGAGAVGGGWWLVGGPLGAKLAVGCLLALGVGAGCVALGVHTGQTRAPAHNSSAARGGHVGVHARGYLAGSLAPTAVVSGPTGQASGRAPAVTQAPVARTPIASSARASREFGPEQATGAGEARTSASAAATTPTAKTASAERAFAAPSASSPARTPPSAGSTSPPSAPPGGVSAAQREFAPG
jgi:RNA polymerase sigma factor (sigma-70 family)